MEMDFDFSGNGLQDIAALVAGLVALGLALQAAVGPTVMMITEAVKAAFNTPSGKGGIIAIGIGCLIGLSIGFLTAIVSDASTSEYIGLALCGGFAGLFMGAGAVKEHKASGAINTEASAAIEADKTFKAEQANVNQSNYATPMAMAYNIPPAPGFARAVADDPYDYRYVEDETEDDLEQGDTEDDTEDEIIRNGPVPGSPILNHQTGSDTPDVAPKATVPVTTGQTL